MEGITSILPLILIMGIFFLTIIWPQRKKEREAQLMRARLEVADEIVTIGGIVGRIISVKDDTVLIETGSDRSKIRVMRWAISENHTPKSKNTLPPIVQNAGKVEDAPASDEGEKTKKSKGGLFGKKNKKAEEKPAAENIPETETETVEEAQEAEPAKEAPPANIPE